MYIVYAHNNNIQTSNDNTFEGCCKNKTFSALAAVTA